LSTPKGLQSFGVAQKVVYKLDYQVDNGRGLLDRWDNRLGSTFGAEDLLSGNNDVVT